MFAVQCSNHCASQNVTKAVYDTTLVKYIFKKIGIHKRKIYPGGVERPSSIEIFGRSISHCQNYCHLANVETTRDGHFDVINKHSCLGLHCDWLIIARPFLIGRYQVAS